MTTPDTTPIRVAVTGTHGYGRAHLDSVARLEQAGTATLVAVADPVPPDPGTVPDHTRVFASLPDLLAQVDVDVVTLATPIHTHVPLAIAALRAGADVLVEKPPVPSAAAFHELVAVVADTGRSCQVGFQSLGSAALERIAELVAGGAIGTVASVGATGTWLRRASYWHRSRWAGHRVLDGAEVTDGVVTNPLAHAVATALRIAGASGFDDVTDVEAELYRANDIESDDTSSLRVHTRTGLPVTAALTLCAPTQTEALVTVHGDAGELRFYYTSDVLEVRRPGQPPVRTEHARTDLLQNLIEHHVDPAVALLVPLASTGSFVRVIEAVRTADVRKVPAEFVDWQDDGEDRHPVLAGVERWVAAADEQAALFSETGAPWAQSS